MDRAYIALCLSSAAALPMICLFSFSADNPCGGKIQAPGSFAVEGMGGPRSAGLYCTWYVEAPVCKIAEVTIYDFSTYDTDDPTCIYERLSVASEDIYYPNIGP